MDNNIIKYDFLRFLSYLHLLKGNAQLLSVTYIKLITEAHNEVINKKQNQQT